MAKDTYYFSHDYNARNDEKVLELRSNFGAEGYGIFWMLIESMAETQDGKLNLSLIGGLSLGYGVAKDRLKEIVDFCLDVGLFQQEMQFFFSKRMAEHKNFRQGLSDKGREGANKRWGGDRGANGDPNAKERKGKERKGKNTLLTGEEHFLKIQEIFYLPYQNQNSEFKKEHTQKDYESFRGFLKGMFRDFEMSELVKNFDKCLGIGDWKRHLKGKGFLVIKPALEKAIAAKEGSRDSMALRIKTFSNGILDDKIFSK